MLNFLSEKNKGNRTIVESLVSSVIGWTATYYLIKKITRQDPEWVVRVVTALHATVITALAVADWYIIRRWDIEKLGEPNTEYEEAILSLTLGYFLFDVVWIAKYQTEGTAMYFHHAASIMCLVLILAEGTSAPEVLVGISGLELTNPCLQARWFLRTYGYHGTWLHTATEFVFMSTFIVFRIFYGSYLTYNIITHPKTHIALKMGTALLYVVSWAFACQMFSYVSKKIKKAKSREV